MSRAQVFWLAAQLLSLLCLALGLAGMEKLRRFLKITRPDLYRELKFPGFNWLRYNFDRRDRGQPNIARMKGNLAVNLAFAAAFWLVALAARFGFLDAWMGPGS